MAHGGAELDWKKMRRAARTLWCHRGLGPRPEGPPRAQSPSSLLSIGAAWLGASCCGGDARDDALKFGDQLSARLQAAAARKRRDAKSAVVS